MLARCPHCRASYEIPDRKIPEKGKILALCKRCGAKFSVPSNGTPSVPAAVPKSVSFTQTRVIDVSQDQLRDHRLVALFDDSPLADRYKILRTRILHRTKEKALNTILVTSPGQGEGKSITAANLAISLAREVEHSVLLVDADLRKPSLHALFGIEISRGITDCLLDQRPLCEVLVNPGIHKLSLLPGCKGLPESAEVMGSPAMRALIHDIKHRYQDRYVLFDGPPVLSGADALVLSRHMDGVILVVEYNRTQRAEIEKTLELLDRVNLVGTVINKTPAPKNGKYTYGR